VPWAGNDPTDRILRHLAEIGAGRCSITDDTIVAEADPDMREVLLGLLVLHEDLTYASRQRTAAETMLRGIAEERARLLEDRKRAIEARDQFLAIAAHELRTPLATLALLVDHLSLDLMMAGMSGWEFRAAQLANVKLSPIPVVILTAANTLTDGVHTLADVEVVEKPVALDALLAVVERYANP
jgi:CheY-like chemotaxis protein